MEAYRSRVSLHCSTMSCEGHDSDAAVAANGRSPRRRREICRSFTCISPSFIFRRWFTGGKSRVLRTKLAERNWGKGEIDTDLDVQREIGIVPSSSPSTEYFSGKFSCALIEIYPFCLLLNILVCNYIFHEM